MIGFDEHRANRLVIRDDRIEGVEEPILGRDAKLNALLEIAARLGLEPADAIAVGDGANDIAMLQAAGLGVAYRAKPRVAAAAHARIDHADLTALLYIQGYSRDEFVEN
jgi:phosphoserine phosphatase